MIDPFLENVYPDLTVGAITWRRFAPHGDPVVTDSGTNLSTIQPVPDPVFRLAVSLKTGESGGNAKRTRGAGVSIKPGA